MDKEKAHKLLCGILPQSEISSNSNYRIEFKNGSSIECLKTDELKTTRGKSFGKNCWCDPDVFLLDNKVLEEIEDYISSLYGIKPTDRVFPITKSYLHHEMTRGSKEQNIQRIRIHDLRHSHVSLLIEMGFSAVAIADRVGHESIDITYRYAHLFPSKQIEIENKLSAERGA